MESLKILLADDHEMILDGLKGLFENVEDVEVIGVARNGVEVLDAVRKIPTLEMVILDLNMPQKDGIEVCVELKRSHPHIKVLILSMHTRTEFITKLIKAGADGYASKEANSQELLQAVRKVRDGGKYFGTDISRSLFENQMLNPSSNDLTSREKEVLALVAKGLNSHEIAERLTISKHTVDSHRKKIGLKLNTNNPAEIIMFALKSGIVKGFDIH